jgi:hypothetical protein
MADPAVRPQCFQVECHTPAPSEFRAWQEWAATKAETHIQTRCPGCNLWHVWVPREVGDA